MKRRSSKKSNQNKEEKRNSLISQFFKPKPEEKKITPGEKSTTTETTNNTPKLNSKNSPLLKNAPKPNTKLDRKAIRKKLEIEYEDNDNAIKIGTKEIRENSSDGEKVKKAKMELIEFDDLFGNKDFVKMRKDEEESFDDGEKFDESKLKERESMIWPAYKGNKVYGKGRDGKYQYFKKVSVNNIKAKDNNILNLGEDKEVYFPYDAYPQQKEFITALYNSLENGQNALLESPTGTGKTLSILTGALGWLYKKHQEKKNLDSKIFYASRTHSQIKQLIKELKSTCYQPVVAILGSRDQLCINKELSDCSGSEKNNRCANLVAAGECSYQKNLEKNSKLARSVYSKKILDIEDLVTEGNSEGFCPFYLTRDMIKDAHIVFLPYNYLTHSGYRDLVKNYIEDSIIIFDEAHNIESVAEDGNSVDFTCEELDKTVEDFGKLYNLLNRNQQNMVEQTKLEKTTESITKTIMDFRDFIRKKTKFAQEYFKESTRGEDIFNVFGEMFKGTGLLNPNIHFNIVDMKTLGSNLKDKFMENFNSNAVDIYNMVRKAQSILKTFSIGYPYVEKWAKFVGKVKKLYENYNEKFKINSIWALRDINHYSLTIEKTSVGYRKYDGKIRFDCLTPKFTLQQISAHQPRSIIFTSGTLQPMNDYEHNFGTEFPSKFSCGHVINTEKQLKVAVIKNLNGKVRANFSYNSRKNVELIDQLGNYILRAAQVTPKGMVVFFPSYGVMEDYFNRWKNKRILLQLKRLKVICKEERNQKKFRISFNKFLASYQTEGAIFFGVTSGKLSEGIDFTDEMARMVIMVGVPFPNVNDPKIKNKKVYLNRKKNEKIRQDIPNSRSLFGGDDWYFVSALRATNQGIGRIIRHKKDFGCIVLIDERYAQNKYKKEISGWVSKQIKTYDDSDDSIRDISKFFKEAENYCSKFEAKQKLKGKSLQDRIQESGKNLKEEVDIFKTLKRSGSMYRSLNSEKELKREKRNSYYKRKEEREKLKKNSSKEITVSVDISIIDSEDDIEEIDGIDAPKPQLFMKKPKVEIVKIDELLDDNKLKRVSTSDRVDFIPELYEKMIPKERKSIVEKEVIEKLQCLICYSNPVEPTGAKCGHIACKACWEGQLNLNKLECPACRKKVRKKNLISIGEKPEIIDI